jgi:hypothetical protein
MPVTRCNIQPIEIQHKPINKKRDRGPRLTLILHPLLCHFSPSFHWRLAVMALKYIDQEIAILFFAEF